MQHGPELQNASITAMPFCIMDGSVFLLVCDVNQDTSIADAHVINADRCRNTLHALSLHLALSLKSCSALHCLLIVHGLPCGSGMFVLSQTLCFIVTHSVVMLPRYFEYNIERGPGNSRVEWIRVYTPGMWQPVAESTLGPAPDHAST